MKSLKLSFLLTLFSIALYAQEDDGLSLNSGTIDNQFEYVIRKSNNYQDYKVVKKTWLYTLKSHTLDSLKALHENLKKNQAVINSQSKEITTLNTNLTNTQNTLNKTNEEKDNISLFGMQLSKTGYNMLMWSIVIGLLAFLIFFIYKFKNSNIITREAKKSLSEVEDEFEEHRKRALEREQKVRRQLQDEINKQKNNG